MWTVDTLSDRLVLLVAFCVGCGSNGSTNDQHAGIGNTCIPDAEKLTGYPGGDLFTQGLDTSSACDVCLINRFQGRVTCPYGQTTDAIEALPADDPSRCRVPPVFEDGVEVPVEPQLTGRRPSDSVYCSCRCSGPEADAEYCDCPSGFECVDFFPLLGDNPEDLARAGSYCIKGGTEYDPAVDYGEPCSSTNPEHGPICGANSP